MRKIFLFIALGFLVACSDDVKVQSANTTDSTNTDDVSYPYTASYSSKFEIGDTKHVQTILKTYKDWDNNTLDNSKDLFADSVSMFFAGGESFIGTRDSLMSMSKQYRNSIGTVSTTVDAVMPLRSTDKQEDWVAVWFVEHRTDSMGKKDSTQMQETWRLNKDGKINLLFQYHQSKPAKK